MRTIAAIASAVALCAGCAPWSAHHEPLPRLATAASCSRTAELLDEREGLLDDMHLSPRQRAQLESSHVRSSQPMTRNGASAGSLAATSLGDVQGIKRSGQVARGNPAGSNPVYWGQSAYASPREFLLLRLRNVDEQLDKLPTREACEAAHLAD